MRREAEDRASKTSPLHLVSAWAADARLVLGQVATADKSNEITAVPVLLEMLSLQGCIVTVDALNCQRATADKVLERSGDYVLALKANQGTLHEDVRLYLDDPAVKPKLERACEVAGDHGRIETREAFITADVDWLQERHAWPGLAAVGKVVRTRESNATTSHETAYYLLSAKLSAERFGQVVRTHWSVENSLHWVLDVTMNEDQSPCRNEVAAPTASMRVPRT